MPLPVKGGETFTLTKNPGGTSYSLSPVTAGGMPVSQAITSGSVLLGAGAVNVLDTFTSPGAAAQALSLNLNRTIDWDHVAGAGALGLAATRSPWGAAAASAYDLWNQLRVKPDGSGGALQDQGTQPVTQDQWCASFFGGVSRTACGSSPTVAVNAWISEQNAANPPTDFNTRTLTLGASQGSNTWFVSRTGCSRSSITRPFACSTDPEAYTISAEVSGTSKQCPGFTDDAGRVWAAGDFDPGLDGKCPTGRFAPTTQSALQQKLNDEKVVAAAQARAADLVKDALQNGVSVQPQQQTLSGPASQSGAPVTSTTQAPDGTTTTQTITPVYNYTYTGGDTVNVTTTTTTASTNNTTNQTTTTTTTTSGTNTPASDICKDNPSISACAQLGTPPDPGALPKEQAPITYTPAIFTSSTSCPAPYTYQIDISAAGYHKLGTLSFQPLCDALATLRPITIAAAYMTAFFVLLAGLKA